MFLDKEGFFGIVSKRQDLSSSGKFAEHFSIGVIVKIIDQQRVMSNLIQNYVEFSVEATQRFLIEKLVLDKDSELVKICEVTRLDDDAEFAQLTKSSERDEKLKIVKQKALRLIELYTQLAKN